MDLNSYIGQTVEITDNNGSYWIKGGQVLTISNIIPRTSCLEITFKERKKKNWKCPYGKGWDPSKYFHPVDTVKNLLDRLDILEDKLKGESNHG